MSSSVFAEPEEGGGAGHVCSVNRWSCVSKNQSLSRHIIHSENLQKSRQTATRFHGVSPPRGLALLIVSFLYSLGTLVPL